MKRCPECRRDYVDDTLLYCLEDGAALVQGSVASSDEPQTAILHDTAAPVEAATRAQMYTTDQTAVLPSDITGVPKAKSFDKRLLLAPLAFAVIVLAGFIGYRYVTPTKQIESIAVMPFVNESGNADVEYLSDGMTETLINSLSQLPNLSVKARSSVFRYKGKELDLKKVASELSVQAILTGRIVQRGDILTLNVELINAVTENVIWGNKYERKSADLVSLQGEIARDVSGNLKSKLSSTDIATVGKVYTINPEAYRLYLKGRYYWLKFPAKDFEKSRDYYQQAIDADPQYALAYAGLSEYYGFGSAIGFLSPDENWPKSEAMAIKALALDDTLPDAHNAMAGVRQGSNDLAGAERELKRTIELNPNYAEGRNHYAHVLLSAGRFDEFFVQINKVLELEPLSVRYNRILAQGFYGNRQYELAIDQYQKTLELDPYDAFTHELLGNTFEQKGMQKEAVTHWSTALRLQGEDETAVDLESAFVASGFNVAVRSLWQKKLEQLNERSNRGQYVPAMNYALAHTRLANKDQAFEWLAKAEKERNGLKYDLKLDPVYDVLSDDPRFTDILKRMTHPS